MSDKTRFLRQDSGRTGFAHRKGHTCPQKFNAGETISACLDCALFGPDNKNPRVWTNCNGTAIAPGKERLAAYREVHKEARR